MLTVQNKYTSEEIQTLPYDSWEGVNSKLEKLQETFNKGQLTSDKKLKCLEEIQDAFKTNKEELASIITKEGGKPISYAKGELDRCITTVQLGIDYLQEFNNEELNLDLKDTPFTSAELRRCARGLIFGIVPFNFPLNLAMHKLVPAIVSGSPILLKPSPFTPLSIVKLFEYLEFTKSEGFANVTVCDNNVSSKISADKRIKTISFTGSDKIGWEINKNNPKKKTVLELGGNAAIYLHKDCAISDDSIEGICFSAFNYAGQVCISTQRLYVHQEIYDHVKHKLIEKAENITSGNPENEEVLNGPVISKNHVDRILNWIDEAKESGCEILTGGDLVSGHDNIIMPTVIETNHKEVKVVTEEVFGPVIVLIKVKDAQEAISHINSSKYGLQNAVYVKDESLIEEFITKVNAGGIIINETPSNRLDAMPYGGVKDSGKGREGVKYAVADFTELKTILKAT